MSKKHIHDNSDVPLDQCNVFVKYLPPNLTESKFYNLFKEFGEIVSSKIMVDHDTGKSLGYGYVCGLGWIVWFVCIFEFIQCDSEMGVVFWLLWFLLWMFLLVVLIVEDV